MTQQTASATGLLFLREDDMRLAQDLVLLGHRDLAAAADAVLARHGLSRAHHRVLHFVGCNPGLTVGALIGLLGVTKQSLARVLTPLLDRGLVQQAAGRVDRRQRLLTLTEAGREVERQLFGTQRDRLAHAYRAAGGAAVEGFRRVMRGLLDAPGRAYLDRRHASR